MDDFDFTPTNPRILTPDLVTTRQRWAIPERDGDECTHQGVYAKTGKRYSLRTKMLVGELLRRAGDGTTPSPL
jgi:hypothetical protein